MKDKAGELLFELVRDYKSRKWITVLGYVVVLILNHTQEWNLTRDDIILITGVVSSYILFEGVADIVERSKR